MRTTFAPMVFEVQTLVGVESSRKDGREAPWKQGVLFLLAWETRTVMRPYYPKEPSCLRTSMPCSCSPPSPPPPLRRRRRSSRLGSSTLPTEHPVQVTPTQNQQPLT